MRMEQLDPLQMQSAARNRRLYDHLLAMGLYVDPVHVDGNPNKIDRLVVSAAPPTVNVVLATDVGLPVEGAEIGEVVSPPEDDRNNVIDFPSVTAVPVAMVRKPD